MSGAAPLRIALWGYGRYGKRLFEVIRAHWSGRYEITAVFDGSVANDGRARTIGGVPLLSTELISEECQARRFDAVLNGVASYVRAEIAERLEELDLPTITLIDRPDFHPFESFSDTAAQSLPFGFELHEYHSLYGFYHPLYSWQTPFYCFSEEGLFPEDMWYMEHLDWDQLILNPAFAPDIEGERVIRLDGEYCLAAYLWANNYWHFTYQTLDRIMLVELSGYKGSYLLVHSNFAEELTKLVGLSCDRVVWLDDLDQDTLYQFEKLLLVNNGNSDLYDSTKSANALLEAAERIERKVSEGGEQGTSYPSRLFVKRIGKRKLKNVDCVLEKYGFTTMIPEELSIADQIRFFMHADIVLCPHGANSTNSLYMRPGTVFIEAFSKKWANPCCVDTLRGKGVHFLPLTEMSIDQDFEPSIDEDFEVDNIILEMLIESAIKLVGQ